MAKKDSLEDTAYEMYKNGMKLVDIANQLGKPAGTIRRWKSTHNWESERSDKKSERSHRKKNAKISVPDDGTMDTLQNDELTPEQQMFCIFYIKSFNATQSYMKAFNCSYETAHAKGYSLLAKVGVKKEVERLKEIKRQNILCEASDLVELNMRIAFSDIGDYVSFGREEREVIGPFGPVKVKDEDGNESVLQVEVNTVKLRESDMVDTQLIQEIKEGKNGVSIKLADKNKAMDWLTKYFMLNPMDKHKQEFDQKRMEIELLKLEMQQSDDADTETEDDNFLDALNHTAKEVWSSE